MVIKSHGITIVHTVFKRSMILPWYIFGKTWHYGTIIIIFKKKSSKKDNHATCSSKVILPWCIFINMVKLWYMKKT